MFSEKAHVKREKALLGEDFLKPNPFTRFVRAKLTYNEGQLIAYPSGFDKSSSVSSLAETNIFIVLPVVREVIKRYVRRCALVGR